MSHIFSEINKQMLFSKEDNMIYYKEQLSNQDLLKEVRG